MVAMAVVVLFTVVLAGSAFAADEDMKDVSLSNPGQISR
jgi:hypothetical protein